MIFDTNKIPVSLCFYKYPECIEEIKNWETKNRNNIIFSLVSERKKIFRYVIKHKHGISKYLLCVPIDENKIEIKKFKKFIFKFLQKDFKFLFKRLEVKKEKIELMKILVFGNINKIFTKNLQAILNEYRIQ